MDRREFLAAAAAGVAGMAGPGGPARGQPASAGAKGDPKPAQRRLRKAVMIGMVQEGGSLLEKFKLLRDCGFEGVELDSPSTIPREEVLGGMKETGIKVHGLVDSAHWRLYLNSPEPKVRAEALKALETALRDGRAYGSTSVLLVPAVVNKDHPYDAAWRLTQEEIRKVLPIAEECGVRIAVENVWNNFIMSPLEAARYVDEFQSPWVGWHFDIGNVITYGWPEQWIDVLGKRTLKLHIKDFSRRKRDEEGMHKGWVDLLDGDAGWPAVMAALDRVGYTTATLADGGGNWATAEVGGGGRDRLRQIAEKMDRIFGMYT